MSDKTREVSVNGKTYLVGKMTPLVASRIHGWLVYVSLKFIQEQANKSIQPESAQETVEVDAKTQAEGMTEAMWLFSPSALSEETCEKIQRYALKVCSYPDGATNAPIPVLMQDGRWTDKTLEDDATVVTIETRTATA